MVLLLKLLPEGGSLEIASLYKFLEAKENLLGFAAALGEL